MAQIYTNETLIQSRERIGRYASFGGMAIIFGGLIASFQNDILLAYGALILGFVVSNLGAYTLNRYGLHAEKKLADSLKGLDKRFRLYSFFLPAPYTLLTPFGVAVLLVKNQEGKISGNKNGWRHAAGVLGALRLFSSEGLGNPTKELATLENKMREFIKENLGTSVSVPVEGYVVFANPQAQVQLGNVEVPVVVLRQDPDGLKNAFRRDKRTATLPDPIYEDLARLFYETAEEKQAEAEKGFRFWQR